MKFNLFKRNKQPKKVKLPIEERSYYSDSLLFNANSTYSSQYAMRISAVYRAVNLISDSIAMLPIGVKVINDGYKESYNEHSAAKVLRNPDPLMSKFNFYKKMLIDVMLSGNAFALIHRDNKGNATELEYLTPQTVTINYNELTRELYYQYNRRPEKIEPINMIHLIKYTNDGVHGLSVITAATNTLALTNDIENQANNFFKSGCALSGVLKVNSSLTDKQKEQIRSSWNTAYTSGGGGLAVLQGNMEYQPISINATDSQLLESRNYQISDIARFFGLSPVLLGDLSKSSYSTLEQTQLQFLSQTLQPYISMIEEELTRKIFRPSEKKYVVDVDEKGLIKTDKATLSNYYIQLLQNGIMTANEIRKEMGLPAIEGGDNTVMQAQYLQQQPNNNVSNEIIENETTIE